MLTSYSAQFPGHKGSNQYVKPTDRHTRGHFPLRCKTTYSRSFINRPQKREDYKYVADQLKTGYDWLGSTTYDNFFVQPNPEYHAKKVKIVEKKDEKPGDKMQFSRTFVFMQAPRMEVNSGRKEALSVQPRENYRPAREAPSASTKKHSPRTATSRQYRETSKPSQPQKTSDYYINK